MRGNFGIPLIHNGTFAIGGKMPVSTSLEYPGYLGKINSGKEIINCFSGYEPCSLNIGATEKELVSTP